MSEARAKISTWQLNTSTDARVEINRWLHYLLRYLHRRYRLERMVNWSQTKPIILGRVRAYQWAREQIAISYSVNEFEQRIRNSLEQMRDHFVEPHACTSDCDELINRGVALRSLLFLLEDDHLRQSWPECSSAWFLLFPPDCEAPHSDKPY